VYGDLVADLIFPLVKTTHPIIILCSTICGVAAFFHRIVNLSQKEKEIKNYETRFFCFLFSVSNVVKGKMT